MNAPSRLLATLVISGATVTLAHASPVTGNIAVYEGATQLGFVSKTFDGQNSYTYSANVANALSVQIDPLTSLFDILGLDGPDAAHPQFGAVGGSSGFYFQSGGLGYAYLAGTGHTPAGSTPSAAAGTSLQSLGYNGPAESMIWSHAGNDLLGQWINADGSSNASQSFYDPAVDFLGLTGDLAAFNSRFGEHAVAVTLRFTGSFDQQALPEPSSLALVGLGLACAAASRRRSSSRVPGPR